MDTNIVLSVKEKGVNFYGTTAEVKENSNGTYGLHFELGYEANNKRYSKLFKAGDSSKNKSDCWEFIKSIYKETAKRYAKLENSTIKIEVCKTVNIDSIKDLDTLFSVTAK